MLLQQQHELFKPFLHDSAFQWIFYSFKKNLLKRQNSLLIDFQQYEIAFTYTKPQTHVNFYITIDGCCSTTLPTKRANENRSITCPSSIDLSSLGRNFQKSVIIYMISRISKPNFDNMHRQQTFSWHYRRELSSLSVEEKKSFVYTKKNIPWHHCRAVHSKGNSSEICVACRLTVRFEILWKRKRFWKDISCLTFFCAVFLAARVITTSSTPSSILWASLLHASICDPEKAHNFFSLFLSVFFFYCGCTYSTRTWPSPSCWKVNVRHQKSKQKKKLPAMHFAFRGKCSITKSTYFFNFKQISYVFFLHLSLGAFHQVCQYFEVETFF